MQLFFIVFLTMKFSSDIKSAKKSENSVWNSRLKLRYKDYSAFSAGISA